jgi:hypothetical protein
MRASSTAAFIAYNLRPAKQTERRLILDFLKCANEVGIAISECRYVGMGGTMFYDFHLFHRFLGVNRMISLERDADVHPRSRFNCPFDFITVKNETVADFLANDRDETVTIYWLDYDGEIGPDVIADITSLGTKVKVGGFAFVTIYAQTPGSLIRVGGEERLAYLQEYLGDFAAGLTQADVANEAFPTTVYRILMAAFQNAFASRADGVFKPLFRVRYRDTSQMVTVGGCLCPKPTASGFARRVRAELPFLWKGSPYQIRSLNLTDRERVLFDMAVTKRQMNSGQARSLRSLGFKKTDFDAYRDLLRFLPRYHESII